MIIGRTESSHRRMLCEFLKKIEEISDISTNGKIRCLPISNTLLLLRGDILIAIRTHPVNTNLYVPAFLSNPFRTAVPLGGQTSSIPSSLSPHRDCSLKDKAYLVPITRCYVLHPLQLQIFVCMYFCVLWNSSRPTINTRIVGKKNEGLKGLGPPPPNPRR